MPEPADHAVRVRPVIGGLQAARMMAAVHVDLGKRPLVEQQAESLTGGALAECVLTVHARAGTGDSPIVQGLTLIP
jgi:hypothetical protein